MFITDFGCDVRKKKETAFIRTAMERQSIRKRPKGRSRSRRLMGGTRKYGRAVMAVTVL